MSDKSPVYAMLKKEELEGYQFIIHFNFKAEMTNVEYPEDMSISRVAEHLLVASNYVLQKVKEKEDHAGCIEEAKTRHGDG